jgi:hypothetical protein
MLPYLGLLPMGFVTTTYPLGDGELSAVLPTQPRAVYFGANFSVKIFDNCSRNPDKPMGFINNHTSA